jgi:hypothetical protein
MIFVTDQPVRTHFGFGVFPDKFLRLFLNVEHYFYTGIFEKTDRFHSTDLDTGIPDIVTLF